MEATEAIKRIVETGKVSTGYRSTLRLLTAGKAKLIIISSNCPKNMKEDVEHKALLTKLQVYSYPGTSLELGEVCRKPFPIAAMAIESPGSVKLTEFAKGAKA